MASIPYHHGDLKNALIKAGTEILASKGLGGLSLRQVAKQAGVSHAAPYAHFKDKQALIAAISTEGFKQLYSQIESVKKTHQAEPETLLIETAWSYVQFALNEPDRFKLMFSSMLEKEKEYPDFVEISQDNFQQLVEIVKLCQQANILKGGDSDLIALSVWGTVHGFVSLLLEGQISHTVLEKGTLKEILISVIQR
ncbi:MAG: TetR/AcrR family transcriptional regulator [Anaerolineales bacterium]|jgi:AcrR family transcriptional regulator